MKTNFSRIALFLAACLSVGPARAAEVKIAALSGSPGAFNVSCNVVFKSSGNVAWVSNSGAGTLVMFRPTTGEVIASVELAQGIGPMTLSFDERLLVVLGVSNQRLYVVDAATMQVKQNMGYQPSGFNARTNPAVTQDGAKIMIADPTRDQIAVFNAADGLLDRYINVGINPTLVTPVPNTNGRLVSVLCSGRVTGDEESLWLIDTLTLAAVDNQRLSPFNLEPFNNIQFSIDGGLGYMPVYNDRGMAVYDLKTHILGSRNLGSTGAAKASASPSGRFLAVTNVTTQSVLLFGLPEAITPLVNISVPGIDLIADARVTWSADGHTLYIPLALTNEILAYDVENLVVRSRIPVGGRPTVLSRSPDGRILVSLDLGTNELSLIAVNPARLYLPHLIQNAKDYSGVALGNFGTEPANVTFIARDNSGAPIPGSSNPAIVTVLPGRQVSRVTAQLFGFNPESTLEGYFDAYTLGSSLTVLYLSGNIIQTQLDGFIADSRVGKLIGFSRITDGISKFGDVTSTEIILENPNDTDASMVLTMYARTLERPAALVAYQNLTLRARQRLRQRVSALVPAAPWPLNQAFLSIESSVPLKGLELVKMGDSIVMIPAVVRGGPDTSYVAVQFVSGGAAKLHTPYFSDLSLVNSSPSDTLTVTMQVTDADGKPVPRGARPSVVTLGPFEAVSGGADVLLGFPNPLEDPDLYEGTLQMTVDKPGLLVDLLYGDARDGAFLTSAELHSAPGTRFALVHYAQGVFGFPPKETYTGLGMYNPNRSMANVVIEAYSPSNVFLGRGNLVLERGSRVNATIRDLVPLIVQQNGGTIIVTSDQPIYLFEVFGGSEVTGGRTVPTYLVAVPPVLLAP